MQIKSVLTFTLFTYDCLSKQITLVHKHGFFNSLHHRYDQ